MQDICQEVESVQFEENQNDIINKVSKDIANYDYIEALEKIKQLF